MNILRSALRLFLVTCFLSLATFTQTQPNLENGFKPYGSHDGSNLDTVTLTNGNWMLHVPLFPDIGQRGAHAAHYFLSANAKNWKVTCIPNTQAATGQDCYWIAGGTGVALDHSNDLPCIGLSIFITMAQPLLTRLLATRSQRPMALPIRCMACRIPPMPMARPRSMKASIRPDIASA